MSTDPTIIAQAAPQLTVNDIVTPIVQQTVAAVTSDLQTRLTALEQSAATAVTAQAPVLVGELSQAAGAVLTTVEHDTLTQRVLVWGIAGAVLAVAIAIVGFALLGNSTASRWIGAAPAAIAALVLWLSNAGVVLPKRTIAPAQVTP